MAIELPLHDDEKQYRALGTSKKRQFSLRRTLLVAAALAFVSLSGSSWFGTGPWSNDVINLEEICPIGDTVRPSSFLQDSSPVDYIIYDPEYRQLAVERLSKAVQIPTISYDNQLSPFDHPEAYQEFEKFHEYLATEFPTVFEQLKVERVNIYGLVLTWEGSNSALKPVLLTGHIDVVPVDNGTRSKWSYDPFSGHFDGENIWGRGSSDCKSLVIGVLQSIERLISDGFKPTRSVLVGFGFDEEIGGPYGAVGINQLLEERYGKESFYSIIDEGGSAIATIDGTVFALPSIGEKGSLTLEISLITPGGHSSVPPDHTNIGLVSKVINEIENTPFKAILEPINPTLHFLQCVAKYSDEFAQELKTNIFKAAYDKVSNFKVLQYLDTVKAYKYLVKTTQAVDIINGGVKSNALPEYTKFVTNHRISVESSIDFTVDKIIGNIKTIAQQYGLGLYYLSEEILPKTENGYFQVGNPEATEQSGLPPAPVSPITGENWKVFAGSIKHIIEDYIYPNLTEPAVVAGNLNTGNTDTNRYWDLTKHIYRYRLSTLNGILNGGTHSVNEHTTISNQLYLTAFNYEYIKSTSEDLTDD